MPPPQPPVTRASFGILLLPALLCAAGGLLDTFAYLAYGHVFANAQTGNIVLLGVSAAGGEWHEALRHLPPLLAFFPGIYAAQWLRQRAGARHETRAAAGALALEIVALAGIALLPSGVPQMPVTFVIAFVAALQSSCFPKIGPWAYTSVVTTGNLRTLGAALFHGVYPGGDPAAHEEARVFAVICAVYAAAAVLGGVLTGRFHRRAIAAPIAVLALALAVSLRGLRAGKHAEATPPG